MKVDRTFLAFVASLGFFLGLVVSVVGYVAEVSSSDPLPVWVVPALPGAYCAFPDGEFLIEVDFFYVPYQEPDNLRK